VLVLKSSQKELFNRIINNSVIRIMNYVILVEQDSSKYKDKTGEEYHFPNAKYLQRIKPGDRVIYYKGRLKPQDASKAKHRLSKEPHYYGAGVVKAIKPDPEMAGHSIAVPFRSNNEYVEDTQGYSNHFMGGNSVRQQPKRVFERIIDEAGIDLDDYEKSDFNDFQQGESGSFESRQEGNKRKVFTTVYERDQQLREQAVAIHGLSCIACGFNFKERYGDWGEGFIHIHHVVPISDRGGERHSVNPATDLVPLCPNCHSMVHR
jgi:predicted HNH restriction endonuclease